MRIWYNIMYSGPSIPYRRNKEVRCGLKKRSKFQRFLVGGHSGSLSATRIIALTFAAIILLGALLLMLPVASRNGVSCGFRPALFTATSLPDSRDK